MRNGLGASWLAVAGLAACLVLTTFVPADAGRRVVHPAHPARDPLLNGFRVPPQAALPRVWWHWMNGNVTETGIRRDLEWMKRIGIGGVDAIDASIATPQVVPRRLVYMSPEWKHAFLLRRASPTGSAWRCRSTPLPVGARPAVPGSCRSRA
ncbi:MAG: glycosyl hydrolase [Rhizomicrobium sp.]